MQLKKLALRYLKNYFTNYNMKQLLTILFFALSLSVIGQSVSLSPTTQTLNIKGGPINKGDTVQITVNYSAPASSSTSVNPTQFYFDFQHQYIGYTLANVTFPTAGANGSALPSTTKTSYSNNYYPGYSFAKNSNNTTTNGYQNSSYAGYNYNQNSGVAIDRIMLTYSATNNAILKSGVLAYLNFIPTTSMPAGYAYDSVYLDFVYGWNSAGQLITTITQPKPASTFIKVSSASNALINGTLRVNSNLTSQYWPSVIFVDSATNKNVASFVPSGTGAFVAASELLPNTTYKVYVQTPGSQAWQMMADVVTISDYTAALREFINQNLDGTYNQTNIHTGIGYLSSDVNFNGKFDGGDVAILFDNAVGNDSTTIITNSAMTGVNGNPVLPVFLTSVFDTLGIKNWSKYTAPNSNFVYYRTSTVASSLNLAYVIPGDITRTYSSQVINGDVPVVDAKYNHKNKNTFGSMSQVATPNSIDVSLNNLTVTSDNITIPVNVNTKGYDVAALQFTFVYDNTKLKFDQIATNVPNQWVTIVSSTPGVIKFTSVDKQLKQSLNGNSVPFSLKFVSVASGLDLNTSVNLLSNADAADINGNQIGINVNSTSIKLTGYNNF